MANSRRNFLTIAMMTSALAVGHAAAEDDKHRAHEAHVHGAWELFAALDGDVVSVTLEGPAIDVLGFEHTPATTEERTVVRESFEALSGSTQLVTLDGGGQCVLSTPANVVLPDGFLDDHDHHDADDEDHGDHEDHHDHTSRTDDDHDDDDHDDDHDDDDDDHDHEDENEDIHSNQVEISYVFECGAPDRLRALSVSGLDAFKAIETIDAVFIGDAKQVADRLTRDTPTLKLK
ncbi:MAG: DUF2796 domain-containing protein [Pseudomonadota bacterium]